MSEATPLDVVPSEERGIDVVSEVEDQRINAMDVEAEQVRENGRADDTAKEPSEPTREELAVSSPASPSHTHSGSVASDLASSPASADSSPQSDAGNEQEHLMIGLLGAEYLRSALSKGVCVCVCV
jgi:hypothetical protein